MKKSLLITTLASISLAGYSLAATVFTDDLTSLGSNLEISDTVGTDNAVTFSASGATFSAVAGNDSRNYIRTTDSDYMSGSYAAEVTWNGLGSAFYGIGGGNVGTYGTPDWDIADSLWVELSGSNDDGPVQGTNPGRFSSSIAPFSGGVVGDNPSEPVRLRIEYDMTANTVTYLADNNYNGTFSADVFTTAIDLSTIGGGTYFTEPGDESRFFFGGGSFGASGPTFSDFSITAIPEPSSVLMAVMGMGMLAFTLRRKK
ncbi:PEP-CTERM sorting domain-containing protein [Kiritimatiellota bacterium B12222]|nr:PEP-CTERM sorting domain-containing protein [Kiritimatiellota bacterium B12222]